MEIIDEVTVNIDAYSIHIVIYHMSIKNDYTSDITVTPVLAFQWDENSAFYSIIVSPRVRSINNDFSNLRFEYFGIRIADWQQHAFAIART